jgi:hypothetical protein
VKKSLWPINNSSWLDYHSSSDASRILTAHPKTTAIQRGVQADARSAPTICLDNRTTDLRLRAID